MKSKFFKSWSARKKRQFMLVLTLILLAGTLTYFWQKHVPEFENWVLLKVEEVSRKKGPVRVWPESVRIQLFPPGVEFQEIRVLPKPEIKTKLKPFIAKRVVGEIGIFALLQGEVRLSRLLIDEASIEVKTKFESQSESTEQKKLSLRDLPLEQLKKLPLDQIELSNIKLKVEDPKAKKSLNIENFHFSVKRLRNSLEVDLRAQNSTWTQPGDFPSITISTEIQGAIDSEGIYVSRFRIQKNKSYIVAAGVLEGTPLDLKILRITGKARANLELKSLSQWIRSTFPKISLPQMKGYFSLDINTDQILGEELSAQFKVQSKNTDVDGYYIGNFSSNGLVSKTNLTINELNIENPGGLVKLDSGSFSFDKKMKFESKVIAQNVDLHQLLTNIKVNKVPVFTDLGAQLKCGGYIKPKPFIECKGQSLIKRIRVRNSVKDPDNIIELKNSKLKGSVTITDKSVSYKSSIDTEAGKGQSQGSISYSKGFLIRYATPEIDLGIVQKIAGISFEGKAAMEGETVGNSKTATFFINTQAKNLFIDDWGTGNSKFTARYKSGILSFNDIIGRNRSTQYKGQVALNLREERVFADIQSPFLDLEEVQELIERQIPLPITVDGNGSAKLILRSPYDLSKSNFDFSTRLSRGIIDKESYDQASINLKSENGVIKVQGASLTKGSGILIGDGSWVLGGNMDLHFRARNMRLEQSETLSSFKVNVTGTANAIIDVKGPLKTPDIKIQSEFNNILVNEEPLDSAKATLGFNESYFEGDVSLGDNILSANFKWPWALRQEYNIDLSFKNWDFSKIFSAFTSSLRANNYQANIDGLVQLSGFRGQPEKGNGNIDIKNLSFETKKAALRSRKPLKAKIKAGRFFIDNFELHGSENFLRVRAPKGVPGHLDLILEAQLDLTLASLFLPFLEDLSGTARVNLKSQGPVTQPVVSGTAVIEDGLLRFEGFPHPLEKINADLIISNTKISLNSTRGKLGGGSFSGLGSIELGSDEGLPIDLRGEFQDVLLRFPEGVQSRGSGQVSLTGAWFPYLLKIRYDVISGRIIQGLGIAESKAKKVEASKYLPRFLAEKRFSPIELDVGVNIQSEVPVKITLPRLSINTPIQGEIITTGTPSSPLLTGKMFLVRGGEIQFRNNVFQITEGYVEYKNDKPENPYLNLTAESRVVTEIRDIDSENKVRTEEREYDVSMRVTGRAQNPSVSVSSQPALSEEQLISLLTLGFISESSRPTTGQDDFVTNTSYQLGSAFINEQLGLSRSIGDRFGVDFDFSSGYDSDDKAAVHTFSIKKQWTPKFGTTASRSVGKTNTNNFKAQYKINKNLSVVGSYEGTEDVGGGTENSLDDQTPNLFGLDVEYRVNFK